MVLTVNPVFSTNNPQTICNGDAYIFNGHTYTSGGNYNDALQSILGCDSIILTNLTVNSIPSTPSITQNGDTLISNSLTGNQWYNSDSDIIIGATDQKYAPIQAGNYYVIVTDSNGCSSLNSNSIYFIHTGIAKNKFNRNFEIYPNPTIDELNIEFNADDKEDITITIYDNLGQVIYYEQLQNYIGTYKKHISFTNRAKGVYLINVHFTDGNITKKFIKQ